ncbi:MAG: hypothetical protein L0241_29955, partial [Planctomycetia bacterium]|nr:hypothetical protein [Planctomycetia bacterium]
MSELTEKPPRLKRIVDPRTGRDLLEDVHPLEVEPLAGASTTVIVQVENGPEAPIELTITSDRDWLKPRSPQLSLLGGQSSQFEVVVEASGSGEFANLCFSWQATAETHHEY